MTEEREPDWLVQARQIIKVINAAQPVYSPLEEAVNAYLTMKAVAQAERQIRHTAIKANCDLLKMLNDIDEAYQLYQVGNETRLKEEMRALHDFLDMKRQMQPN